MAVSPVDAVLYPTTEIMSHSYVGPLRSPFQVFNEEKKTKKDNKRQQFVKVKKLNCKIKMGYENKKIRCRT